MQETLTKIEAKQVNKGYLLSLYSYRELFYFFIWRDILVRYRQAFFGIAWALIRPLLTMSMFTLIFGFLAKFPAGEVSYPLFVLAGMIPWQLFASATQDTSLCLMNNAHLITKAFFPRAIIPASQIMIHLVDFAVNLLFLAILFVAGGQPAGYPLVFLPLFILLLIALCLGVAFFVSALTVQYRDFRIIVPFFLQFGMFLSPVGYGTFILPPHLQYFYFLNPLAGIIDGIRWSLFGMTYPLLGVSILYSCLITSALLILGFIYFRKIERTLADKI
jgi:lipopolysaccharide transport system permease protein